MCPATPVPALERIGLRVLTARDGEEGIAVFEQHADEIACVLLDLTMPRMGGREALTHMRRIRPHVPIILCSGFAEPAVGASPADECAAFLHKPFGSSELERVVRSHVIGERSD